MNMFDVTLVEADGGLAVTFGEFRLPVPPEVLAARPALRKFAGSTVVLGIRPEDMEDASLETGVPAERVISTRVDLREALGSEVVMHATIDAPPAMTDDAKDLAKDVGADALEHVRQQAERGRSTLIARLNPRTAVRKDDPIDLVVDTSRLHFFDPATGLTITDV